MYVCYCFIKADLELNMMDVTIDKMNIMTEVNSLYIKCNYNCKIIDLMMLSYFENDMIIYKVDLQ